MRGSYPCISVADLSTVENRIGKSLPDEYRNFLLENNGGCPEFQKFSKLGEENSYFGILSWFFGICPGNQNDLVLTVERLSDRVPDNVIPIACDPSGNFVVLSVDKEDRGKIYFWDHEEECDEGEVPTYDNLYLVANNFNDFLQNLREIDF